MKRREFLAASAIAAGANALLPGSIASGQSTPAANSRDLYEIRRYQLRSGPQADLLERYYRDAAIPALHRAGVRPVGVFNMTVGQRMPAIYVLLTHPSVGSVLSVQQRLADDKEHLRQGAEFLNATSSNPAFERMESWILLSFRTMPNLAVPALGPQHSNRIFELRTYESHSYPANTQKVDMFDQHEIDIFRRNGIQPVFFGNTVAGSNMPSLTYMLVYENHAAHDKAWASFSADPAWKTLRSTPGYTNAEIVSNVSNCFLTPLACSEI